MNASKASTERRVVILGTGGTIAGTADSATDSVGYRAASLGVEALVAAVPPLAGWPIECLQMAQLDSKDMTLATWLALAAAVQKQLQRAEVGGVVITHGTDTLEETAYFLHRTLAPAKPVVMAAAMRPASSLQADGPQNLLDAVTLARSGALDGVLAVLGGQVYAAVDLRKQHGWRVQAFGAGDAGVLALLQDGVLQRFREPARATAHPAAVAMPADAAAWPTVEIVTSHAGASGTAIDALVAAGAQGLVIAGTGNGSVHQSLLQAARRASDAGVPVVRASRCLLGGVFGAAADALPSYGALTPWQARIELMLDLLIRPR
ncbi:MAG: ansB [Proteobacteria bacterium]|jgi:L-asparaginase|nr:ansB [Pseudomonadota bacterium]